MGQSNNTESVGSKKKGNMWLQEKGKSQNSKPQDPMVEDKGKQ